MEPFTIPSHLTWLSQFPQGLIRSFVARVGNSKPATVTQPIATPHTASGATTRAVEKIDPVAEFTSAVQAESARSGSDRRQASAVVAREQPALHESFIAATGRR